MRIVIAGQTYHPGNNGQAVFTIRLAEGLVQMGHQVTVVAPAPQLKTTVEIHQGVKVLAIAAIHLRQLHHNAYFVPYPYTVLTNLFTDFNPDIVHIQDHYPLSRSITRIAKKFNVPVMGTNHFLPDNVMPYLHAPKIIQPAITRILWETVRELYNRLQCITTPTETAAMILRGQNFNVPVYSVSCGVDLQRFQPEPTVNRPEVLSRYGLSADKKVTLYVGRIDAEKRLDVIIEAIHRLNRDDIQFAIVGKGEYQSVLQAKIDALGLHNQVVFTGYVSIAELSTLLNSVDFFAMPSEAELQSIATLEAMATGLPVLAADACALPELIESAVNGFLFKAGNVEDAAFKLAYLADHPENWQAMGQQNIKKAQLHGLENTVKRYEALYFNLNPNAHPATRKVGYKQWASI